MDYKEKYEEIIKNLKEAKETMGGYTFSSVVDKIIPELKESEDEKIKEDLIQWISEFPDIIWRGHYTKDVIAWLEKQGEMKSDINDDILLRFAFYQYDDDTLYLSSVFVEECNRKRGYGSKILKAAEEVAKTLGISKIRLKVETNSWMEEWYKRNGYEYLTSEGKYDWLEKQCKQKSISNSIPKFKVNDWITDGTSTFQIVKIEDEWYIADDGDKVCFDVIHQYYHLWTIEDAKDGDVLAFDSEYKGNRMVQVGIIKKYVGKHGGCSNTFNIYVGVNWDNNLQIDEYMGCSDIRPATEEQYDLLFSKMKEAGYEWDDEKKELRKIEKRPVMLQWQGNNLKEVLDFTGKNKNFEKWFKSFEEYEKYVYDHDGIFKIFNEDGSHYEVPIGAWIVKTPDGYNVASRANFKQKSAWSEEDERMINSIIKNLDEGEWLDIYQVDWLKSFKDIVKPQSKQERSEGDLE
jgi:GNAT superfamily N-acetyltransferase